VIQRPASGRRVGPACVRPGKRTHTHRRCTRWIGVDHFTHADDAGSNHFHFTGRVNGHKLRAGRYRLHASPRNASGVGPATNARFKIKRR
jgi:hypothetical protein